MPTYVYACRGCDARLEVMQRMSDAPLTECEKCGGSLRRVLFPPAIVYKGSGFYTTDYKNGGSSASSSGSSDSSGSESKSEGKSDTKSERKSETPAATSTESKTEAKTST